MICIMNALWSGFLGYDHFRRMALLDRVLPCPNFIKLIASRFAQPEMNDGFPAILYRKKLDGITSQGITQFSKSS